MKLSSLVLEYLARGNKEYAILLYILARKGELTIEEIYEICRGKSRGAVRSWLAYMSIGMNPILIRKARGVYALNPNIEKDIEETERVLRKYGIEPRELVKEQEVNQGTEEQEQEPTNTMIIEVLYILSRIENRLENLEKEIVQIKKTLSKILRLLVDKE